MTISRADLSDMSNPGFALLFASYSLVLSAHITSTVNAVIIRIQLLGPLRHDVWLPYPQGISSFGA